jgi:hypothetical protein
MSVNYPHCASATEFFDARDKVSVWQDIIAFRLHYHQEIAFPFHIEQYLSLPLTLGKEGMEGIYRAILG